MLTDRTILHCDLNNFFASVECLDRPDLKNRPVAVCGDPEKRHGIILAKNECAKKYGVKTGEPILVALAKCSDLVFLPAHYEKYIYYSGAMRDLYRRYTDRIESFGIDECWLDVTESENLFGNGVTIANDLRALAKKELGLTISAGVSYNKIFAKMGSDYKKPDATTVITRENYKDLLWRLPIEDLMFVGPSTAARLRRFYINTIGDLAAMSPELLGRYFGKNGLQLQAYANGLDPSPVCEDSYRRPPKSIGNSVTCPYDLTTDDEVRTVLFMLCDSVATRLRRHGVKCRVIGVSLRDKNLVIRQRHRALAKETELSTVLFSAAFALYLTLKDETVPIRSLGVCAVKLTESESVQLSFLDDSIVIAKKEKVEETVDLLRNKYGREIIGGALYLTHPDLTSDHPLTHRIRPGGYDDSK